MAKWKCEICGSEFENFHAQGFNHKIYCPLCFFKKKNQELKKQLEEANNFIKKSGFVNIEQVMLNYCGLLIKQKEFIKYLEDENKKLDIKANGMGASSERDELIIKARTCRKILKKYREIIGE